MNFLLYILSGLIGVSNMILWGCYGDLVAEKFEKYKILRSLILGIIGSVAIFIVNPQLPLIVVALTAISFERAFTELYKIFFRVEDQKKYLIPSDLGLKLPRTIKNIMGVFTFGAFLIFLLFIDFEINPILLIVFAGLFTAIGGMSKDAPFEGFEPLKFFRSPILALLSGFILISLPILISSKFLLLSVLGMERIFSEFYKKIYRGKIPGKFASDDYSTDWRARRAKVILPLYTINVVILLALVALTFIR